MEEVSTRDALRAKNLFALGLLSWLYDRPTAVTETWIETKFASRKAVARGQPRGLPRRLVLRRDDRADRHADPRARRPRHGARHLPHRQRHHGDRARAGRRERAQRPSARLRLISDHSRLGAPARARAPPQGRCAHDPGRGRDRGGRDGARRRLRGRARRHGDERARDGPQGRDGRPGGDARAADADHRRPARRSLDRDAHQDRAVGPADGALRAPRRVAAADRLRVHAGAMLPRRRSRPCASRCATARP